MAAGIETALESESVTVAINAEKPRKAAFEVRVDGTVIASTGPEDRPFPALKALDVDSIAKTAADTAIAAYFLG